MTSISGGFNGDLRGGKGKNSPLKAVEFIADPNDLIDSIVDAIDYAEMARDTQGLIKARKLLNNDLRQAIDLYVQDEVTKALRAKRLNLSGH
ncbi:MAG: hypothetical protein EHM41_03945 [Chloroflexi bacterium]|nr:MAG: hypothetical protein EHM41_03945 [Chloroflexota bacterium]